MSKVLAKYDEKDRREITSAVLEHMAAGNSMARSCEHVGADAASVLKWIEQDAALEVEYERLKISRARALVEQSLDEIENLTDPAESKLVDIRVRNKMRLAALLNPKEFSDKTHSNPQKGTGSRAVGFVFNIGSQSARVSQDEDGCVTVDVTPNSSEIT